MEGELSTPNRLPGLPGPGAASARRRARQAGSVDSLRRSPYCEGMFDTSLVKDLTEMLGKSLTFKDIDAVGGYLFKDHAYSTHALAGVDKGVSISPLNAAKKLVEECERRGKLKELFAFAFELEGVPLNSRNVTLAGLENLLYRLSRTGVQYNFAKRRFVDFQQDKKSLPGWGALRNGKEYPVVVASVDICRNSELVRRHKPAVMEKVYYELWEYLRYKLELYEGRIWSWAGDGGLLAFRGEASIPAAVSCCLEVLYTMPVFNIQPRKPIKDDICLRLALDFGPVKFFEDTGRIVSEVINYAAHLEKKGTRPGALSISDAVYSRLPAGMQRLFPEKQVFEGRDAYSTAAS
jgi:class 3 adenylate cyclase